LIRRLETGTPDSCQLGPTSGSLGCVGDVRACRTFDNVTPDFDCQVLVVGAGPTGMALALDLALRGIDVRIVDRAQRPSEGSRARTLQPRSLEILDFLGVAHDLGVMRDARPAGSARVTLRLYDGTRPIADLAWADKRNRWFRRALVRPGVPYRWPVLVPQTRLEQVLRDRLALAGVSIEAGLAVTGLRQDEDSVTAWVAGSGSASTDGAEDVRRRAIRAAYLVAADGADSTVRNLLGIPLEFPGSLATDESQGARAATTSTALRTSAASSVTSSALTASSSTIANHRRTGGSSRNGLSDSSAATAPSAMVCVAGDVVVAGMQPDEVTHCWYAGDRIVTLSPNPASSERGTPTWALRIVYPQHEHSAARVSRTMCESLVREVSGHSSVRLLDAPWLDTWDTSVGIAGQMRVGRVFLAGDAAHAYPPDPPPDGSPGLNLGLQDAANLGWKLAAVVCGAGEDLLDSYEAERRPATLSVWSRGADPVRHLVGRSPLLRGPLALLRSYTRTQAVARRRHDRNGHIDLNHRESRLSQELGGRRVLLRAGDRVPNVRLWSPLDGADVRLFDLLRDGRWLAVGLGSMTAEALYQVTLQFGAAVRCEVVGGGLGTAPGLTLLDRYGEARQMLGARGGSVLVVRPDGHLGLRCGANAEIINAYLEDLVPVTEAAVARRLDLGPGNEATRVSRSHGGGHH